MVTFLVFLVLDFLDTVLCLVYRFIDEFLEGKVLTCYCQKQRSDNDDDGGDGDGNGDSELSETLFGRKNIFREMGFLGFSKKLCENNDLEKIECSKQRWSDCGCESCLSWMSSNSVLHVSITQSSQQANEENDEKSVEENVIFLHGFLSSSSLWTETVFQNITNYSNQVTNCNVNYKLFGVDLLGFGRSPKPRDCFYTIKDHLEMIEKSIIIPYQLDSFHLVAHSMGCNIALALAAKHSKSVKSITLVAPPIFPSKFGAKRVLEELAKRELWPPLLFGSAVMSWYEHIGRTICLLVCRFHRTWEKLLKLLLKKKSLHFMILDLARHTHHSAWHSMHNVLCGGNKLMEKYLRVLSEAKVKICVIHGDKDKIAPVECTYNIKRMAPNAEINIIRGANHNTIILGRENDFTTNLQLTWASSSLHHDDDE
ncbi:hypothetical protein G4B88_008885 [Cannabis sativa]|uniref:AB hydrolase-1 domain-containing protein n=2 Tax=Cannabis sativa TaxID=3483 RepID=A0A7J6HQQ5_CANSA|nr:hypothetical protein G4B88_008885 [Cannabis sativa]